jgi:hypothetical protein
MCICYYDITVEEVEEVYNLSYLLIFLFFKVDDRNSKTRPIFIFFKTTKLYLILPLS